jgi:hypothetical protein
LTYSFIQQIALIPEFWNVKPCEVISRQRIFICIRLSLPMIWSHIDFSKFLEIVINMSVQFICVFGDFIVVLQCTCLVLFTGQYFSHINIKFVEPVHLCSQRPSTARVTSTITFRYVSVLPTTFNFLGFEYQDDVLQLCMFLIYTTN